MPKRTLHLDIQADDNFINLIDTHIRKQWSAMDVMERKIVSVLIKALNDSRQAHTNELVALLPEPTVNTTLDDVISTLRTKYRIPVIVSVGRGGGYRLPISRAECNWFLQTEVTALFRRIERLASAQKAMAVFGVHSFPGMDAFSTLLKVHQMEATDGAETAKKARRR